MSRTKQYPTKLGKINAKPNKIKARQKNQAFNWRELDPTYELSSASSKEERPKDGGDVGNLEILKQMLSDFLVSNIEE